MTVLGGDSVATVLIPTAAAYVMIPLISATNTVTTVNGSFCTLIATRAINSERPNATHGAGNPGNRRCRTAVTMTTAVVAPAAVKSVRTSNHWAGAPVGPTGPLLMGHVLPHCVVPKYHSPKPWPGSV